MGPVPDSVIAYLRALLDQEWAVKDALERRAVAMLSAHTASIAAALAGAALSGAKAALTEGAPLVLNVVSVVLVLTSVGAALLALQPMDYPVVDVGDLRELVESGSDDGVAETTVDDIELVRNANAPKAVALLASQALYAGAVIAFVTALLIALD